MAFYQGGLDALCGQYAIANAFMQYGFQDGRYFETACRAVARRRWPDVLWEGTSVGDMRRMIRRCLRVHDELSDVTVSYPFWRDPPGSNEAYWKRFDGTFGDPSVRFAILGLEKPDPHWIVVFRDGQRLLFVDSNPFRPRVRKNRKSLHAGERRKSKNQWLINRRELIAFRSEDL